MLDRGRKDHQFVEKFREEIPRYMVKHQVRPGTDRMGTGEWLSGRYFDPEADRV